MKHRTRLQIQTELTRAGMPSHDAVFFSRAAGLSRDSARLFVDSNKETSPIISIEAQRKLFEEVTVPETVADIRRLLAKSDSQQPFGPLTWEELPPAAQEILFDLRYRGDYRPFTRQALQPILASGDMEALAALMSDWGYWAALGVPRERIKARAELLEDLATPRHAQQMN